MTGELPRPEYLRPQFRRPEWTNLNGEWRFAFDDEDAGLVQGWHRVSAEDLHSGGSPFDRRITVPFCYQSRMSGIGDTSFHDVVWYARTFDSLPGAGDKRLLLHFGAVDYRAAVWVNGTQVVLHEGGHTPFYADVTPALGEGENVVVVRAEDPSRDATIPREFSVQGYSEIFNTTSQTPVLRWFLNSLMAAVAHTALVLVTAAPAAYALARMHFRGKGLMFAIIISTLFIPHIILIIPNYLIVDMFGWLDTLLAVIVPSVPTALYLFLLRQFFVSLPRELEEAALLDGANRFQIFLRVILPLSKAPLATVAVLSFLANWNDFLWPVYVLFNPQNLTLQPGLSRLQGAYQTEYPIIMAGGVLASIPVLIVFLLAQRYIIEGVSRSGLKG